MSTRSCIRQSWATVSPHTGACHVSARGHKRCTPAGGFAHLGPLHAHGQCLRAHLAHRARDAAWHRQLGRRRRRGSSRIQCTLSPPTHWLKLWCVCLVAALFGLILQACAPPHTVNRTRNSQRVIGSEDSCRGCRSCVIC